MISPCKLSIFTSEQLHSAEEVYFLTLLQLFQPVFPVYLLFTPPPSPPSFSTVLPKYLSSCHLCQVYKGEKVPQEGRRVLGCHRLRQRRGTALSTGVSLDEGRLQLKCFFFRVLICDVCISFWSFSLILGLCMA